MLSEKSVKMSFSLSRSDLSKASDAIRFLSGLSGPSLVNIGRSEQSIREETGCASNPTNNNDTPLIDIPRAV